MMKKISPLIFVAFVCFAAVQNAEASISNGAPAIDELGQYNDSLVAPAPVYTKFLENNTPNGFSMSPHSVAIDSINHRLFLSDRDNNRVLVYNLTAANVFIDRVPDYVLGQQNFYTNVPAVTQSSMNGPTALAYDSVGNRLFVADTSNKRVLIFTTAAITNGMNAAYVLGQANFSSAIGATTQSGMKSPLGLAYDVSGNRLFVTDDQNDRTLVFNTATISNGMDAAYVLGQPDFISDTATSTSAKSMDFPSGPAYDAVGHRLFIPDRNYNRVLVFDVSSITNNESAVAVLGQSDFISNDALLTQNKMGIPMAAAYDSSNNRLFIADSEWHRILVFDVSSITNGEDAISVLGQSNFTTADAGATQHNLNHPRGITYDSGSNRLYVGDSLNEREMIFDVSTVANGENAVDMLGFYDDNLTNPSPVFTASDTVNKLGFRTPRSVALDAVNHRLFVSDKDNNRVLVYNLTAANLLMDHIPDYVLGQTNFYSHAAATTQSGMSGPFGLAYDSVKNYLYVADSNNNRVLVFDVVSVVNGENAIKVLGQIDFVSGGSALTRKNFSSPTGIAYHAAKHRLFVADQTNNRVMVFDVGSITNGENATDVLGQANFIVNAPATTQSGLNSPYGVAIDSQANRLFVADTGNNRVIAYDVASVTSGEAAVGVFGQQNFTSGSPALSQNGMNTPGGVIYDTAHGRLFVSDVANNRVLVFDAALITNGESAINVLGQGDFLSNASLVAQTSTFVPVGLEYDFGGGRLYVTDGANRVMIFDAGINTTTPPPPAFLDITPPKVSNVSVNNRTSSSATVKWTTDEPATSYVEFGEYPTITDSSIVDSTLVDKHSVDIVGLSPYTKYAYSIHSRDAVGNETITEIYNFTTTR